MALLCVSLSLADVVVVVVIVVVGVASSKAKSRICNLLSYDLYLDRNLFTLFPSFRFQTIRTHIMSSSRLKIMGRTPKPAGADGIDPQPMPECMWRDWEMPREPEASVSADRTFYVKSHQEPLHYWKQIVFTG